MRFNDDAVMMKRHKKERRALRTASIAYVQITGEADAPREKAAKGNGDAQQ